MGVDRRTIEAAWWGQKRSCSQKKRSSQICPPMGAGTGREICQRALSIIWKLKFIRLFFLKQQRTLQFPITESRKLFPRWHRAEISILFLQTNVQTLSGSLESLCIFFQYLIWRRGLNQLFGLWWKMDESRHDQTGRSLFCECWR